MQAQTAAAIAQADAVLFLVDARAGATGADRAFADLVRKSGKPAILVANKSEGRAGAAGALEAYSLGLGEPIAISAEHGEGLADLYDALAPALPEATAPRKPNETRMLPASAPDGPPHPDRHRRPPQYRQIDADQSFARRGSAADRARKPGSRAIRLRSISIGTAGDSAIHDTAGMRRRSRIEEKLEKLSVADTLNAIRFAEVVIVLDRYRRRRSKSRTSGLPTLSSGKGAPSSLR